MNGIHTSELYFRLFGNKLGMYLSDEKIVSHMKKSPHLTFSPIHRITRISDVHSKSQHTNVDSDVLQTPSHQLIDTNVSLCIFNAAPKYASTVIHPGVMTVRLRAVHSRDIRQRIPKDKLVWVCVWIYSVQTPKFLAVAIARAIGTFKFSIWPHTHIIRSSVYHSERVCLPCGRASCASQHICSTRWDKGGYMEIPANHKTFKKFWRVVGNKLDHSAQNVLLLDEKMRLAGRKRMWNKLTP